MEVEVWVGGLVYGGFRWCSLGMHAVASSHSLCVGEVIVHPSVVWLQ